MKKSYIFQLLLLALLPILGACSKEEIVFETELQNFELREGYQLVELVVPYGTFADDNIYIIGDFNGGEEIAVGDPRWLMQKSTESDYKWGIYINPADCINGKTLADGYTFYNVEEGMERTLDDKPAMHYEVPAVGGWVNIFASRWASYFTTPVDPGEIVHDGYVLYVVDNSEYTDLALYAWNEDGAPFGDWPGIKPTGTVEKDGVKYKYFDTGAVNEGVFMHLIFNNNGNGKQLPDYDVTLNQDFYLELTPDGVIEYDPSSNIPHDGYTIYVNNLSGWDALYLYMWGDVNDLNGGWPGMSPTGTQVINGVTYTYFDLGASNCDAGLTEHVILNNGSGTQIDDVVVFALDRDVYIELSSNSAKEIDPADYAPDAE